MRVLLTSWSWPTHYYWLMPMAWACRAAGHEVLVAVPPAGVAGASRAGLPVVAVGSDFDELPVIAKYYWSSPIAEISARGGEVDWERMRAAGERPLSVYALLSSFMQDDLLALTRSWRPDVMVYDAVNYAAPLVAAACGVPAVRQIWGVDFSSQLAPFAPEALARHRARLGLAEDEGDVLGALTLDPCPPSMQLDDGIRRLPVRHPPYNGPGRAPRWLLERPRRPRVCVTWGTVSHLFGERLFPLAGVLRALSGLDIEVVAAVSPRDRAELGPVPANTRVVENLPLHLFLSGCDLVVSHGGGGVVGAAIDAGVPQLTVPRTSEQVLICRSLAGTGAGEMIALDDASPALLREQVARLLGSAAHEDAARALMREARAQRPLSRTVADLEALAAARAAGGRTRGGAPCA
ncbi:nucleotide disphospho-sugar-binding domain-containing protein [Streptomyces sp. NPDC059708]|uniref:nucleotide disphospho-sugar-binding domain-containing protein n=1 Tax=Streptomyces sp. NPDC059708 TaxID=3346916 RepID=UPI0036807E11